MQLGKQKHIVTHAGSFHADEIMAIALLEEFFLLGPIRVNTSDDTKEEFDIITGNTIIQGGGVWDVHGIEDCRLPHIVIRTRDAKLLEAARDSDNVFVIDVGGVKDFAKLNFDHHQASMTEGWSDGTPYSSTGLIWVWLKENGHLSSLDKMIIDEMEEKIIRPLDAHDNGISTCSVAQIIAGFNRSSDDPVEQNYQFDRALNSMRDILTNYLHTANLKYEATVVLTKEWEIAQRKGESVVALREAIAYHDCAGLLKQISKGKADMIIIPGQGNRYSVISLPIDIPFSICSPCPEEWRGQMGKKVKIDDRDILIRFAHKTGFMCVVEGSFGDAKKVAKYIVRRNKHDKSYQNNNKPLDNKPNQIKKEHTKPTRKMSP